MITLKELVFMFLAFVAFSFHAFSLVLVGLQHVTFLKTRVLVLILIIK